MYRSTFVKVLLLLIIATSTYGQKLEKVHISDPLIAKELKKFLKHCTKTDAQYGHRGVVMLTLRPDTDDEYRFVSLYQRLDDSFKNRLPPHYYAHFQEKVILIYDQNKPIYPWTEEQKNFLLDEIGNRVYVAQTKPAGWIETYHPDGSLKARYQKVNMLTFGGSPFDITLKINKKTKKVTYLYSV
ncbi:hypothetical protein GCM10027275_07450 [Rhabdobacter roseus]